MSCAPDADGLLDPRFQSKNRTMYDAKCLATPTPTARDAWTWPVGAWNDGLFDVLSGMDGRVKPAMCPSGSSPPRSSTSNAWPMHGGVLTTVPPPASPVLAMPLPCPL